MQCCQGEHEDWKRSCILSRICRDVATVESYIIASSTNKRGHPSSSDDDLEESKDFLRWLCAWPANANSIRPGAALVKLALINARLLRDLEDLVNTNLKDDIPAQLKVAKASV